MVLTVVDDVVVLAVVDDTVVLTVVVEVIVLTVVVDVIDGSTPLSSAPVKSFADPVVIDAATVAEKSAVDTAFSVTAPVDAAAATEAEKSCVMSRVAPPV